MNPSLFETDEALRSFLLTSGAPALMICGVAFFLLLYLAFSLGTLFLSLGVLPWLGIGYRFNSSPVKKGQVKSEIIHSLGSVLVFGLGLIVPWSFIRLGWARISGDFLPASIAVEMAVLVIWNEIYFYLCHRILHTAGFRKFHLPHHKSVVPTPWATYSFHPIEAIFLGSVLLLPMLVHPFNAISLVFLPFFSLFYNSVGHSNYNFLPRANVERWWLNGSRRHLLHHSHSTGNFGFMLPFMDRLFGTALPDEDS
jgi:sterol desaturase/sphingolipid hydroxylase (fatty acid hydroxylase superfamily)